MSKEIKDLINETKYFYDVPDCIFEANDYQDLISRSFDLTEGILKLENFKGTDSENHFEFEIIVNGEKLSFNINISSDYVEGNDLVNNLNLINKKLTDTNNEYYFTLLTADFGIAYVTDSEEKVLIENGNVWKNQ